MEIRVLEWNINQRVGCGSDNRDEIPFWIVDEIKGNDSQVRPDIIILCEVGTDKNWKDICQRFEEEYFIHTSANTSQGQNDIAIMVNKKFNIVNVDNSKISCPNERNPIPDYLRVDCKMETQDLTIIGVRLHALSLKKESEKEREKELAKISKIKKKEFKFILEQTKNIKNPILIGGDFNNYRRGTPHSIWNLEVLNTLASNAGLEVHTPDGSSINEENASYKYQFAEDHFLTKDLSYKNLLSYNRNFTLRDPNIYKKGKNLQSIVPPNPDHAILYGIFSTSI